MNADSGVYDPVIPAKAGIHASDARHNPHDDSSNREIRERRSVSSGRGQRKTVSRQDAENAKKRESSYPLALRDPVRLRSEPTLSDSRMGQAWRLCERSNSLSFHD